MQAHVILKITIFLTACSIIFFGWNQSLFQSHGVQGSEDGYQSARDGYLCRRDLELMKLITDEEKPKRMEDNFYQMVMSPLETVCSQKFRFGGVWRGWGYDGGKVLCMDDFEANRPCLVYSFGLRGEVSFEESMLELGCHVHAYDLNVDESILQSYLNGSKPFSERMHIVPKFVGGKAAPKKGDYVRLQEEFKRNGHSKVNVTYLKVDVEGNEVQLLPEWLDLGLLDNVQQVGIEMHQAVKFPEVLESYDNIIRRLHAEGFRMIYWECNMLKMYNWHSVHCSTFEIVFVRKKSYCER